MLERLTGWFGLLWDSGKSLQEHSADIKELKQQNGQLLNLVQMLAVQNQQTHRDLTHERELREQQIESLRRELADSQEKIELRLRLEISEKLRQLPRGE